MSKQLVLVSDSVYGPGGLSVELLFTEKTDLASLIRELDVLRTAKRNDEREAWSLKTIKEDISTGTIKDDDWWCLIENPTFTLRLDGFERKWWAVGLGNHQRDLEAYCVVMPHPNIYKPWVDIVSLENGSLQGAVESAFKKALKVILFSNWPERHEASIFPLAASSVFRFDTTEEGLANFVS